MLGKPLVKEDDFPDLSVAAKVKESKKEKKKKQVLSLGEFMKSDVGGGSSVPAFGSRRGGGGGDIDLSSLPTAPRPRVEGEEAPSRHLGGGFREYGGEARGGGPRGGHLRCVRAARQCGQRLPTTVGWLSVLLLQ